MAKVYRKKYYNTATGLMGTTPDMAAEYARRAAHQQSQLNMNRSRMEQLAAQHAAGLESQERIQGTFDARAQHTERLVEAQNRFLENQAKLKQKAEQAMQAGKQNFAVKMQQMAHQQGVEAAKLKYQLENEQYEARNPALGFQRQLFDVMGNALPSGQQPPGYMPEGGEGGVDPSARGQRFLGPDEMQDFVRRYMYNMAGLTPPGAGPSEKDKIRGGQAKQKIKEGDIKGAEDVLENIEDPALRAAVEADLEDLSPAEADARMREAIQEQIGTYKKPEGEFATAMNEIESDFESAVSVFANMGYQDQETELAYLGFTIERHADKIAKRTNLDFYDVERYLILQLAEKYPEWRPYLEKMAVQDYGGAYKKRPSSWMDYAKYASPVFPAAEKAFSYFQD